MILLCVRSECTYISEDDRRLIFVTGPDATIIEEDSYIPQVAKLFPVPLRFILAYKTYK